MLHLCSDEITMEITSILVPSVHELAKEPLNKVPEPYVLPAEDIVILSNVTSLPQVIITIFYLSL